MDDGDFEGRGSSPHTRGAHFEGIAGTLPIPDHPRIRGEHRDSGLLDIRDVGSSPHTRGARHRLVRRLLPARIIPAYAGSTRRGACRRQSPSDHPRIRGEHTRLGASARHPTGSSPHTRGALFHVARFGAGLGIIPAYAGSTIWIPVWVVSMTDHPRIRGEHDIWVGDLDRLVGSSPHTRGAPEQPSTKSPWSRIIPAYAGSTSLAGPGRPGHADHPRIRGEHGLGGARRHQECGSSPHTRGARRRSAAPRIRTRIIPAYAGSTCPPRRAGRTAADHPRIRGEHISCSRFVPAIMGSSPHTRGAPSAGG